MVDEKQPGTKCRSCGSEIVWTRTSLGRLMPMDVSPREDGQFYLFRRPDHVVCLHVGSEDRLASIAKERGDKRYSSHFSTCPDADQHRRSKP